MQAVALVTGDEFLVSFNLTIDTADVFDFIDQLNVDYDTYENYGIFDDYYGIDFARIIGPTGFCFNFNMITTAELFHLDQ
jgi:hypothetical protein